MSFDKRAFRDALGQFATGICIVSADHENGQRLGVTINSFTSVSLEPPLVLWSLQNDGDCTKLLAKVRHYSISVLAADQQALSHRYAQRGDHMLAPEHYRIGKTGVPIIRGALANFECRVWQKYPGGDHELWVGEVMAMECSNHTDPLLFYSGSYRHLR